MAEEVVDQSGANDDAAQEEQGAPGTDAHLQVESVTEEEKSATVPEPAHVSSVEAEAQEEKTKEEDKKEQGNDAPSAPNAKSAEGEQAVKVDDLPKQVQSRASENPGASAGGSPAHSEAAGSAVQAVRDHKSYAGTFSKGRFHRTYKFQLEALTPEEMKAVSEDLQNNRSLKALEIARKKKVHAVQKKKRKAEEQERLRKLTEQQAELKEQRRTQNIEKLSTWLANKEVVLKNDMKESQRILTEVAAKRKAQVDLKAANEARDAAVREERLRKHKEAQLRQEERQSEAATFRREPSREATQIAWDPSRPASITHHHLHHHVHYHSGSALGSRIERSVEIFQPQRKPRNEAGVSENEFYRPLKPSFRNQLDCADIEQESESAVMDDFPGSRPPSRLMLNSQATSCPDRGELPTQTSMPVRRPQSQPADHSLREQTYKNGWGESGIDGEFPPTVEEGWQGLFQDYEEELHKDWLASASSSQNASRPGSRGLGPGKALRGMGLPRQGCQDLVPLGRMHSHASRLDLLALTSTDKRIMRSESAGRVRPAKEMPSRTQKKAFGTPVVGPIYMSSVKKAELTYSAARAPVLGQAWS
eukprot:gnl/MRDRNA2_/MRDRNA2_110416_c0_seq1.p1 gnl/MRDRNA2_/MRDRNA2_110416_c0~~gnl/MRDRNA2_/MRDRNA2_110416_c0_seq1.p1  ORF type:complete len:614 (+),score=143.25 gnl/MRDRNA2_/MRDRNA2_110416_c0_seq1:75-1844(+)